MTTLAAYVLRDDSLIVCGAEGRRWMVAVPVGRAPRAVAEDACLVVRSTIQSTTDAPPADDELVLPSLRAVVEHGAKVSEPTIVRWAYAGHEYRMRLPERGGRSLMGSILNRLLSTVADAHEAHALVADPVFVSRGARGQSCVRRGPVPGVLERWMGDAWQHHKLDPPPLVDPVTGVLRRLIARPPHPSAPSNFVHFHAELPFLSSIDGRFHPDPLAPAGGFTGATEPPQQSALLSGLAHYCGAYLGQGERRWGSAQGLQQEGDAVLTVEEWQPHDPALHDQPGFPFVRDHPALEQWWLRGDALTGRRWVPISLVHAGYLASELPGLSVTNFHNLVGLQAGFARSDAVDRASAHLIAQDAVARWWSSGEIPSDPLPDAALPDAALPGLESSPWVIRLLAVPTPFAVPVRLAVVDDPVDGVISLGYGCAASATDAGLRALSEALIQHASARDLAAPSSLIRDSATLGNGAVAGLAPYDAQRGYAGGEFEDRRRLIDPMCHLQYGLSPEIVSHTRARTMPSGTTCDVTRDRRGSPFSALIDAGVDTVVVDVTTERVRASGAIAVRVLARGLRRLAVGAFPDASSRDAAIYPGW